MDKQIDENKICMEILKNNIMFEYNMIDYQFNKFIVVFKLLFCFNLLEWSYEYVNSFML